MISSDKIFSKCYNIVKKLFGKYFTIRLHSLAAAQSSSLHTRALSGKRSAIRAYLK